MFPVIAIGDRWLREPRGDNLGIASRVATILGSSQAIRPADREGVLPVDLSGDGGLRSALGSTAALMVAPPGGVAIFSAGVHDAHTDPYLRSWLLSAMGMIAVCDRPVVVIQQTFCLDAPKANGTCSSAARRWLGKANAALLQEIQRRNYRIGGHGIAIVSTVDLVVTDYADQAWPSGYGLRKVAAAVALETLRLTGLAAE